MASHRPQFGRIISVTLGLWVLASGFVAVRAEPQWRGGASRSSERAELSEPPALTERVKAAPLPAKDRADLRAGEIELAGDESGDRLDSGAAPRFARVAESQAPTGGQVWREYDLRPYLNRVRGLENPQQPIVDWILRETGTDRWFGATAGLLSVEQEKLRVYQVPEVQAVIADLVDRYVHPDLPNYGVSVRLVTVQSVNWRSVAMTWLEPIRVETAGVEAWLLTRENYALLMAHLRQRVDVQEHNSAAVQIAHGQSHAIERYQPRTYPQNVQLTPERYPGYQVQMGKIEEGFSLRISPLMAADVRSIDAVVDCRVDQLEKFTPLSLDVPSRPGAAVGRVQIQVPQVASWRINERFRWPVDRVLLISRGVVAMPGLAGNQPLLVKALTVGAPRADALLFLECQPIDRASGSGPTSEARVGRLNYHGRY